jgi:hypothetical protein
MSTYSATEFTKSLRQLADFIDLNAELFPSAPSPNTVSCFCREVPKDEQKALAASVAKAMGHAAKNTFLDNIYLRKDFGSGVTFDVWFRRESICERVVKGTEVLPARPAYTIAAVPEREVEIVEWKCTPIMEAVNA